MSGGLTAEQNKRRKEAKRKVIEAEYQKKAQIANERIAAITKAHEEKVYVWHPSVTSPGF